MSFLSKNSLTLNLQSTFFNSKILLAGMAELVDAQDLKSCVLQRACGFESRSRHKKFVDSLKL